MLKQFVLLFYCTIATQLVACGQTKNTQKKTTAKMEPTFEVQKTEKEWQEILSPDQYYILRQRGTERPFTGKYYLHKEKGIYCCAGCGNELFKDDAKFDTHCGWPSFYEPLHEKSVVERTDYSHGMIRTEVVCGKCGGHLGHVFPDAPQTPTGLRYCINSLSLDFKEESKK